MAIERHCPWCNGRGCIMCDAHKTQYQVAHMKQLEQERKEAEARAFLREFQKRFNPDPGVELVPDRLTIEMAIAAIQHGKETIRRELEGSPPDGNALEQRFQMLDFAERKKPNKADGAVMTITPIDL